MDKLQIFKSEEFGEIRTAEIDGKPYFVANEVAEKLGYTNPSKATKDHCKHSVMWWGNDSLGRPQRFKVIPESDLYRLIIKSKLPSAERFETWVMEEVLPSIRKTGGYIAGQESMSDIELLSKAVLVAQKQIEERNHKIQEMTPKALFADAVAASNTSILIGDLAKLICQNGIEIGQKRLFEWLRENGYLIKQKGTSWNMPTQRSIEMGLFEVKETTITHSDGHITINKTVKVTGKAQVYFVNKFLSKKKSESSETAV